MQVSFSRIDCYAKCQYQYKLKYIDKLETYPDYKPANPLIIGTALHTGIEKGISEAIQKYHEYFPVLNDNCIDEQIKFVDMIRKCRRMIPKGEYEFHIENDEFIGYLDLLVPVEEGVYDLYDFKYSNSVDYYLQSDQLHIYKFYFEKITGKKIRKMYFLFAPKTAIRMKKKNKTNLRDETLEEFRKRIKDTIEPKKPTLVEVEYDIEKVKHFLKLAKQCKEATTFEKKPYDRFCEFCNFKNYCQFGDELDIIQKEN